MGEISGKLRALYRNVEAEGGCAVTDFEHGVNHGIEWALRWLADAGFSEGKSTAADMIDAAPDAAFMAEVREVLERCERVLLWGEPEPKPVLSSVRALLEKMDPSNG